MRKIALIVAMLVLVGGGCVSFGATSNTNQSAQVEKVGLTTEELFAKKKECSEIGMERYARDQKENPNLSFAVPQFAFNKELNTCLYKTAFVDGKLLENSVIDLFTNETILVSAFFDGELQCKFYGPNCYDTPDYKAKAAALMGQ